MIRARGLSTLALTSKLESHARLNLERPPGYEMSTTKGREEVIERNLVGYVHRGKAQGQLLVFCAEQIVSADTEIKKMTRSDTRRIRKSSIRIPANHSGIPRTQYHMSVNRKVVGSSPTSGAIVLNTI